MVQYMVIEALVHDAVLRTQVWSLLLRRGTDAYEPTHGMMFGMMLTSMKFISPLGMDKG